MFEGLNWAIIYNGKIRALFATRWQAEKYIDTCYNKDDWCIKFVKAGDSDGE